MKQVTRAPKLFLSAITLVATSASINAATINWGTPQTISTAAVDVETIGIPVFALNAHSDGDGTSSITVTGQNGIDVEFTTYDAVNAESISGFSSKFRDDANFGGGSSDYGGLVDRGFFHGDNAIDTQTAAFSTDTIVLSGLTIGEEYLIQYWSQDADRHSGFLTVLDGSANLILDTDSDNAIDYGQFVVGTFIADATTQSFSVSGTLDGSNNYGRAQLNALQLRVMAEPFIEWQPSIDMYSGSTTETFVENWSATSVLAYNATSADGVTANPTITLNNVTFTSIDSATLNTGYTDATSGVSIQAAASNEHATAFLDGAFSNNSDIYNVIASGHWALNEFTISGLTPGTNYQIQVFNNDARRDANYQVGFSDGSQSHANSITAGTAGLSDLNNDDVGDESGDSIIGTFTAVSATQTFAIRGTNDAGASWNNGSQSQINALQIAVVPDPLPLMPLTIGTTEQQKMRYGMDYERLWYWGSLSNADERDVARWSAVDADVDFVRVAMNSGYELTENTFDLSAYTNRIIPVMQRMQEANPNIKFFASPRPLDEAVSGAAWQPYPLWVTDISNDESDPVSYTSTSYDFGDIKCAEYIVKYLILMKTYGFKISFLDITNEWQSNVGGGRITQDDMDDIHNYLHVTYMAAPWEHPDYPGVTLTAEDIPQIVGPSSWSISQGTTWVSNLDAGDKEALSIVSTHNTDRAGDAQSFANAVYDKWSEAGDTIPEIWNTEVHGWKSTSGANETTSFYFYLEAIRAGFGGINGWLAIGTTGQGHAYILNPSGTPTRNVKYHIYQKLSSTSNYGHALDILEEPEVDILNAPLGTNDDDIPRNVAAFIKGNLMTVWVINENTTPVPLDITPAGRTIATPTVRLTRWTDPSDVEGFESIIPITSNTSFEAEIPGESVCCFEIVLDSETFASQRYEAEDYSHQWGTTTEDHTTYYNLGNIGNGDWTRYGSVALAEDTTVAFHVARPSGRPDGFIRIREGSADGAILGEVDVPETGNWQVYQTVEAQLDVEAGIYNLYLEFVEDVTTTGYAFVNFDWFEVQVGEDPTNVTEAPLSGTEITLNWTAVPDAVGYTVKRSTTQGGPYTVIDDTVTGTSYTDTGLTAGTAYYYIVATRYATYESGESDEIVAVPSIPIVVEDLHFDSSTFGIGSDGGNGEAFHFSITNSVPGHSYQTEKNDDLTVDNWIDAEAPQDGNNGLLQFVIPIGENDPKYFFRLKISQQ